MKTAAVLFCCVVLATAISTEARAHDVFVTFDPYGLIAWAAQPAFVLFNLYVIGDQIGDVVGWQIAMMVPPSITVADRIINNGPGENLGGEDNYLIELGGCYGSPGADYEFIRYDLAYLLPPPADDTFCLTVSDASGAEAGYLAYVDCAHQLQEMCPGHNSCHPDLDGCAVINPSNPCTLTKREGNCGIVHAETRSWAAMKAAY